MTLFERQELDRRTDVIVKFNQKYPKPFDYTIVNTVFDLRMSCNGASDPWPNMQLQDVALYLKLRLNYWQSNNDEIDMCVNMILRAGVEIAIAELVVREKDGWVFAFNPEDIPFSLVPDDKIGCHVGWDELAKDAWSEYFPNIQRIGTEENARIYHEQRGNK